MEDFSLVEFITGLVSLGVIALIIVLVFKGCKKDNSFEAGILATDGTYYMDSSLDYPQLVVENGKMTLYSHENLYYTYSNPEYTSEGYYVWNDISSHWKFYISFKSETEVIIKLVKKDKSIFAGLGKAVLQKLQGTYQKR